MLQRAAGLWVSIGRRDNSTRCFADSIVYALAAEDPLAQPLLKRASVLDGALIGDLYLGALGLHLKGGRSPVSLLRVMALYAKQATQLTDRELLRRGIDLVTEHLSDKCSPDLENAIAVALEQARGPLPWANWTRWLEGSSKESRTFNSARRPTKIAFGQSDSHGNAPL